MSYLFPPSRNPAAQPRNRNTSTLWRFPALLALAGLLCLAATGCARDLGASTRGWGSVAAVNDVVYATTLQGQLYALNDLGPDGVSARWISTIGADRGFHGAYNPPAVGRYLYVAGIDGFLYAFDPPAAGGPVEVAWRKPNIEAEDMTPLVGSPGLDEAGGIVAVGSEDGGLYAYNALTGEELRWSPFRAEPGGEIWSTPVLRNGVAYFGSQNGTVYAVDLTTGAEKWRYETGGAIVAKPLIFNNLLIVGSFDRQLYALGLNDGQPRWQHEAANWWWAAPVASERAIFAPSMDGKVYALDANGTLLWAYDVGAPIVASPVLLERGLVVGTVAGKLAVLRASVSDHGPAQEIASLTVGDAEIKAPLIVASNRSAGLADPPDSVYIGSDDGKVRRVQVRSGINIMWCYDTSENTRCN